MSKYKPDEEYHFKESEPPVAYTAGPAQPKKDKDFKGRRRGTRIILLLAILMAFWAIYKFIGTFLSTPKPVSSKKPFAPTQMQTPATPSKPQPAQLTFPPKPAPLTEPTLSTAQIQEISDQKTRLNKMETEIVNLQTTLAETNTRLSDLSTRIDNLATQANKPPPVVEIQRPIIRRPRRPVKRPEITFGPHITPTYNLQAAIPGRAWIMRRDGTTLTVSPGDRIAGYGRVTAIDPNEGVVQTSSGANIKYETH